MRIDVAIADIAEAAPVLSTVAIRSEQACGPSTFQYLANGTYAFAGSAQVEIMITDSETGELLAAGTDRRIGGGRINTAPHGESGDADDAVALWAKRLTNGVSAWRSGEPALAIAQ